MVRGFCAVILLGIVAFVCGCAPHHQVVILPDKVEVYTVELEFKLVKVDPSAPAEEPAPSEAPLEETEPAIEPVEPPADEPTEKTEPSDDVTPAEPSEAEETKPSDNPGDPSVEEKPLLIIPPSEPMDLEIPPEVMKEILRSIQNGVYILADNETMVYEVQQTLTVGGKIDVKRVEVVKFMDIISDVPVEVEGNRMFSIEGKTSQIPGKDDFSLSVLVTFKDDKLKLNFSCETSIVVSAVENSQQVIATVDDLKLVLICRNIQKIEYEK